MYRHAKVHNNVLNVAPK